jgi:16S rRNA G966 N2-methylase RsmD
MASILYKWLIVFFLIGFTGGNHHPIFVSVTQIEHNAASKTLEISCKIFTDDFEQALRQQNKTKVDLLDPAYKKAMNILVNNYIQKHLQLKVDEKNVAMEFLGFEQQEEGIISYLQVNDIITVKKVAVTDNILYETKPQQMEIIHVTANGNRKSSRLNNPEDKVSFEF